MTALTTIPAITYMRASAMLITCALFAGTLHAQAIFTFDAGGSSVRYSDATKSSAATIGSSMQLQGTWTRLDGGINYASFGSKSWSAQGSLYASLSTPQLGALSGEFSVLGAGTMHDNDTHTAQALGTIRGYLSALNFGMWAGGGIGTVSSADSSGKKMVRGDIGFWARSKPITFIATAMPTSIDGGIKYTDVEGRADLEIKKLDLSAAVGTRAGQQAIQGASKGWGNVSATYWIFPRVGITSSAGSYPYDFAQGYPGGKYVTMSLRFRSAVRESESLDYTMLKDETVNSVQPPTYSFALGIRGEEKRLRIKADSATNVEIMADFTNWIPQPLIASQQTGWWELDVPLSSGIHHINFRTDNGEWRVPNGMGVTQDDFNGQVGLLIVP